MEPNRTYSSLLCFQKKFCWCTQNYLWDVWWKCYNH